MNQSLASSDLTHAHLLVTPDSMLGKQLTALIDMHDLPLELFIHSCERINNKALQVWADNHPDTTVLAEQRWGVCCYTKGMKVAPRWEQLQRRVVQAGRGSEQLLQAVKLQRDMQVIDATAGFGHDALILASTGAQVILLEQQSILVLLMLYEQQQLCQSARWHKLMARLHIVCTQATTYLAQCQQSVDLVYLDPMFPTDSYQDAKVGKHMQWLHQHAPPPTYHQQHQLLTQALFSVNPDGQVVVKRPNGAPPLAKYPAEYHVSADTLRFDRYTKSSLAGI